MTNASLAYASPRYDLEITFRVHRDRVLAQTATNRRRQQAQIQNDAESTAKATRGATRCAIAAQNKLNIAWSGTASGWTFLG